MDQDEIRGIIKDLIMDFWPDDRRELDSPAVLPATVQDSFNSLVVVFSDGSKFRVVVTEEGR